LNVVAPTRQLARTLAWLAIALLTACAQTDQWADIERQARAGDAQAQLDLGLRYRYGNGIAQDLAQARQWLELSAAQQLPAGQYHLGELHARQRDPAALAKARALFEAVHASGSSMADDALAELLATSASSTLEDGAYAVRLIEPALRDGHSTDIEMFEVLAAAYARAGRFAEAIGAERHAVTDDDCRCKKKLLRAREARLAAYQRGETWSEALVSQP